MPRDTYSGEFRDSMAFDPSEKTAISVRDGVIEYLGVELQMEPSDKMFTVYRSPATIANAAMLMPGIPMTSAHVPLDVPASEDGGHVISADMVDAHDEIKSATIAIRNKLTLSDTLNFEVEAGKKELSLGYNADLVPHDKYDFEQLNIKPHHLAAVQSGRCGSMCSFLDRKSIIEDTQMTQLHKAFCDKEGAMNLQQIVELSAALPEAIKSVPVDQLTELLPALQQIVDAAKEVAPVDESETPAEDLPTEDENSEESVLAEDLPTEDENSEEEKPRQFGDADVKKFTDKAIREHAAVIEKARQFLPETYQFADKDTMEIMREALATEQTDQFADGEVPIAFKLLKKQPSNYQDFGDSTPSSFSSLQDKEL